jgi:two-component system, NtrC family, sensor kinase
MPIPPSSHPVTVSPPMPRAELSSPPRWLGSNIIFFTTIIAAIVAIMGYWMVRSMLLDSIKRNVLLEVKKEADDVDRWLATRMAEIQTIASNPTVKTLDWQLIHPYFDQEVDRIQDFVSISLGLSDGVYYNSYIGGRFFAPGSNIPRNIADRAYFQKAMAGEANISDPFISRSLKIANIAIAAPIWQDRYRSKAPIAEIHAQVKVDRVAEIVQALRYGDGSYAFVVNPKGEAIVHPERNLMTLVEKPAPSLHNHADRGIANLADLMIKGENSIILTQIKGAQTYVAYAPLPTAKWSIALVIPRQNIESQLATLNIFALFLATLPVAATAFAWKQIQLVRQAESRLYILQNQKYNLKQYQKLLRQQGQAAQTTLDDLQRTQSHLLNSQAMSNLGQLFIGMIEEIKTPGEIIAQQVKQGQEELQTIDDLFQKILAQPLPPGSSWTERHINHLAQAMSRLETSLQTSQVNLHHIHSLTLSMKGLTQSPQQLETININHLLDDTVRLLEHRLAPQNHHPAIQAIRQYANLPLLECYVAPTHQVFMHLLNNAIDAIAQRFYQGGQIESPSIRIRTQLLHSGRILIRITDNGCGIPEANQAKLFTPFFTTKSQQQGIGIGLFICQNIIQQHQGHIRCISIPNRGTDFLIELPLKQLRQKPASHHPQNAPTPTATTITAFNHHVIAPIGMTQLVNQTNHPNPSQNSRQQSHHSMDWL